MNKELERIRQSMALLQQSAEGCALNHYGYDSDECGMPGWLIDTNADLERFAEILATKNEIAINALQQIRKEAIDYSHPYLAGHLGKIACDALAKMEPAQ